MMLDATRERLEKAPRVEGKNYERLYLAHAAEPIRAVSGHGVDGRAGSRHGCATVERLRSGEHVPGQVAASTADCGLASPAD